MKDNELLDKNNVEKLARIAIILVLIEFKKAYEKNSPFNSQHEGYAVLLEELDELWDEIKLKDELRDPKNTLAEAVQVTAMGLRFIVDCCLSKNKNN